jgi:hypothetical protein
MVTKIGLAVVSLLFVMGLALTSMAAREIIDGQVEKVDVIKGELTVKTEAGPRTIKSRTPEKLKDLKMGDKVHLTIQEDGTLVIEKK